MPWKSHNQNSNEGKCRNKSSCLHCNNFLSVWVSMTFPPEGLPNCALEFLSNSEKPFPSLPACLQVSDVTLLKMCTSRLFYWVLSTVDYFCKFCNMTNKNYSRVKTSSNFIIYHVLSFSIILPNLSHSSENIRILAE